MKKISLLLLTAALAGCGGISSVPYVEPAQSAGTAKVRVITNSTVYGNSLPSHCMPKVWQKMAEAGRQTEQGRVSEKYPQFPLQPKKVGGMPDRKAPRLMKVPPQIVRSEGMNVEVETEYLVPTNAPFLVSTNGIFLGNTNSFCPRASSVFDLEAGASYEIVVGMQYIPTLGGSTLMCPMMVRKLLPAEQDSKRLPLIVTPKPPPTETCSS